MSNAAAIERLLGTDPADAGCAEAMRILHVYAELTATGPAGGGRDAASRFPGVAAHLARCGPCGEDLRGLLAAITEDH
jgi:hypothetical protein